jgi:N-acetyl sugar amidotransferase
MTASDLGGTPPDFRAGLQYCTRCCFPETLEGVDFDDMGICSACRSSEEKMKIDWAERERDLVRILDEAKAAAGTNYDCILPISGGKDSFFQAHVLTKVYGLKPLAVTFSHNWFSETGFYNLQRCLEVFELDHIQFTPNRAVINKLAAKSIPAIGDACWHCHAGVGAFPLNVAVRWKIPLLIWGESIAEADGRATYRNQPYKFDRDYFTKVSARLYPQQMVDGTITARDVFPFELPSYEEIDDAGVHGIHLGDYIFWDDERQMEFVRDVYGWRETEMEGAYKGYKSAECIMPGVHDFSCYMKRGFGRSTWQAAQDVRSGLLDRDDAIELASTFDARRPEALDYYLEITGMEESDFFAALDRQKHPSLKGVSLPIIERPGANKEKLVPFVQQLIAKHLGRTDARVEGQD